MNSQHKQAGQYAKVNGLKMYYEIHGSGMPQVFIHVGGSTIKSTFGGILPGGHGDYIGETCAADKQSAVPALVTAMIEAFLRE